MTRESIIKCEKCGRDYLYKSNGNSYPGGKDWETGCCPYCGAEGPSEFISGSIYTYKIDEDGKPIYK